MPITLRQQALNQYMMQNPYQHPAEYAAQDALGAQRINQNVANYYQANPQEAAGALAPIGGVQNDPMYGGVPAAQVPATTTGSLDPRLMQDTMNQWYANNPKPAPYVPPAPNTGGSWMTGDPSQGKQWVPDGGVIAMGGGYTPPSYTPPPAAPGSATATNPFLNLGLNAFTNTQQGFDTSYLDNLSKNLYQQAGKAYAENFAPAMDSAAITAGGYGGDRAALAKGYVQNNLMQNVANSMAPQYVGAYENSMNRALQGGQAAASTGTALENLDVNKLLGLGNLGVSSYNADTSRQLGMGNLNLGQYQADTQRQLGVGALNTNQYQADTQRQLGMGDLANKNYLAQGQVANWANQAANPQYTNPWGAAIGGGLLGYQLLNSIIGNKP